MEKEVMQVEDVKTENNEEGASLVEYALLVALIAVVAITAITFLGDTVSSKFSEIGSNLAPA